MEPNPCVIDLVDTLTKGGSFRSTVGDRSPLS